MLVMMSIMTPAILDQEEYVLLDHDIVTGEGETQYVLRVRDLPVPEKPREKLLAAGPDDLTTAELVAILLGVGTRKEEVMSMAQRILQEYGERTIMNETSPRRLSAALDIPITKACQIVACFELGRRYFGNRAGQPVFVRTAQAAFEHLRSMGSLQKEQLRGLYLNSRYQVIHEEIISVGSLTANIVHPREVFRPAIECGAVAVIVAHNHPSGSLEPTAADGEVTQQLLATGKIIGIELLDHLIIANDHYVSVTSL
jgi:DNA repair protein RadC